MMKYTPMAIWGRELRYYRQRAGLKQIELSEKIRYSVSLISQIETGQTPATPEFATACDDALDTDGALSRLLDYRKSDFPPWFGEWLPYEQNSSILRSFQPRVVDGLLQTPEYASAVLHGDEEGVQARLDRQRILEGADAPTLHVVLDESVLWRDIGGPEVMYRQLMHLVEVSSQKVRIQVLPNGSHPSKGAFVLATLKTGESAVYLESSVRSMVTASPQDLLRAEDLWESIKSEALPVKASLELINKTAEERWKA